MKILILSNLYPNQANGIRGSFVRSQVLSLAQIGCLTKVVSPVPMVPFPIGFTVKKWKDYRRIPGKIKDFGIEVFHPRYLLMPRNLLLEYAGWSYYMGVRKLANRLYREWKFGLIHAHTAYPDGYAAMILSRSLNIPFIVTIHGRDLQDTIKRSEGLRRRILQVLKNASAVVNVSRKLEGLCRLYTGEKTRIKIVGNGIELSDLYNGQSPLKKIYAGHRIILSVGSLRKTKGHDLTLQAIKALKPEFENIRLLIIGGGEEKNNLQKMARDMSIDDCVEFIPPQPHQTVMEYMSICDLFVLPSWSEGFGIAYLEAMAHGKPVIGVKGQGVEDFVLSGETGLLVKEFDAGDLAGSMAAVLRDNSLAVRLGENAKKSVVNSYTWQESARKVMDIYGSVLNERLVDV